LSAGTHLITASATDRGGLTGRAQRTVIVRPPNVAPAVSIAAPTSGTSLITGKPVLLAATATDAEDGDLTTAVRWASSRDGALGTGGALVLASLSVGSHTITASATDRDGGITTATVTINVAPATVTFAAVADTYVDASKATTVFGTATSIAGLSSPAKIAFLRFAVAGVGNLKVQQAKLRLTAVSASNSGGVLKSLTNGTWSEASTNYNTRPTRDGPTVATQGSAAAQLRSGIHTITARVADAGGLTGQAQITLTVLNAPVVRITAPANGSAFFAANGPIGFSGSATDVEDGNISGRVQWSSDRDGALASGANITASQLSIGTHTITAMAIDDDGLHGQASISIRVRGPNEAPHLTITSPADGTSVPAGTPTALIAAVTDDFDTNLEG